MTDSPEQIIREHSGRVYRLALSMSGNHADAEDITQEAFIAILHALPGFRGDATTSTWIYRISLRVGSKWLARQGRISSRLQEQAVADERIPIDLINAIQELPAKLRTVIQLVAIEGLSHAEAADVLAVPEGTIASRMHYARKKLAESLDT